MSRQPVAVLVADVHYSVHTLNIADIAMRQAIEKANTLKVPLIIAGDLHDTKANLRGECIKAMIKTIQKCVIPPFILVGNHDRINEKSPEHSLEFLRPYANIVDAPLKNAIPDWTLVPYYSNSEDLVEYLNLGGKNFIVHQGVHGTLAGQYIQDKSAISRADLLGLRCISGHYHTRQSFDLPNGGKFDYIGNPYSLGFGEANDPDKGYQVLFDDTTLEFHSTNCRKHRIIEIDAMSVPSVGIGPLNVNPTDILWIKVKGPNDIICNFTKDMLRKDCGITQDFRLDLIPDSNIEYKVSKSNKPPQILDDIISLLDPMTDDRKERLKKLWRELV